MPPVKDLIGLRSGRLVIFAFEGTAGGKSLWRAKCDCGRIRVVAADTFKYGRVVSCGCRRLVAWGAAAKAAHAKRRLEARGRVLGEYTLVRSLEHRLGYWRVRHTCGRIRTARLEDVRKKRTRCRCESVLPKISSIDAAWLASAIDGEGTICFGGDRRSNGIRLHPVVAVANTVPAYVKRSLNAAGCGLISRRNPREDDRNGFGRVGYYHTWAVAKWEQVEHVLRAVLPHLVIKQAKAAAVIECCEYRKSLQVDGMVRLKTERYPKLARFVLTRYLVKFQPASKVALQCRAVLRRKRFL